MKKRLTLLDEAKYLAISLHGAQTYDGYPYYYHLEEVVDVLKEFGFTEDKYMISGYLHDSIEDGATSYQKIKRKFGEEIAEIVYCVTDELGRNRKERKTKTYPKINGNRDAVIVKLADRIANMRNSIKNDSPQKEMYMDEYIEFRNALSIHTEDNELQEMWMELDNLLHPLMKTKK